MSTHDKSDYEILCEYESRMNELARIPTPIWDAACVLLRELPSQQATGLLVSMAPAHGVTTPQIARLMGWLTHMDDLPY